MDALKAQFGELRTLWDAVRGKIGAQPEPWEPYMASSSAEEISGIIAVLSGWLERQREPGTPAHRITAVLMENSLKNAVDPLKDVAEKGPGPQFAVFLLGLRQTLSAARSMAAVAGTDAGGGDAALGLHGLPAESFLLAGETRRDLRLKPGLFEKAGAIARETDERLRQDGPSRDKKPQPRE